MVFDDSSNYPAPACARGLWILQCLSLADEAMTLEQLFQKAGIPKATLSRILDTLVQMELVYRHQNRTYEAMVQLQKKGKDEASFEKRLLVEMTTLSKKRGFTVEWYEPSIKGMVLQQSVSSLLERKVWAKEGFIRNWQGEIEAVYRVGRAFLPDSYPVNETPWYYGARGERTFIRWEKACKEFNRIKAEAGCSDIHFNENGVRRSAVAIHYQGLFKGVLALAECWTPATDMKVNLELPHLTIIRQLFTK